MNGPTTDNASRPSAGFWLETWRGFRKRRLAVAALGFVLLLGTLAVASPFIAGVKPIAMSYKERLYFPALGYFARGWERPVQPADDFFGRYDEELFAKDPESWAIWPPIYQDPSRPVYGDQEWPGLERNPQQRNGAPSATNWFGTYKRGTDVFTRMLHGTRVTLLIGFVSTGVAAAIGITVGAVAGYFGSWVDTLLSRLIEVVMCIPALVLVLALLAVIEKPSIWHVMLVLGATGWTGIARLTRAEFLKLKTQDFVTAAQAIGVGRLRIMSRHVLRNALAPILVPITFGIAGAILTESALSFLGLGPADALSWGRLLQAGRASNNEHWWLIVFPGAAIFLTVLAYNLIGEALQEATDPRLKQASH
ncbi:MAG: ABC transporter permease [Planctomycetota bacterium]